MGELVSGMCALCGVFIITCPIPLMVATFSILYKKRFYRNRIMARRMQAGSQNTHI